MVDTKLRQNQGMKTSPSARRHYALVACLIGLSATLSSTEATAQVQLWGGRPELSVWIERETSADKSLVANSVTLMPSLSYKNGAVNRVELLINTERDTDSSTGADTYSNLHGLAIRARKDVALADHLGIYFRGLLGRSQSDSSRFWYGYSDAALSVEYGFFDFMLGVRIQRALDETTDQAFNKLRLGPGFNIADKHRIEINWARSWQAESHALNSDSVLLEYTFKF